MKSTNRYILFFLLLLPKLLPAIDYPYPVHYIHLHNQQQAVSMAYMDVPATHPNGQSVLLLHGKNFNGYYWKQTIAFLTEAGYRVVVPDQIGFGKSSKPDLHYSFQLLAQNTHALLDSLKIKTVVVIGHSMGGMLAVRFALLYPDDVSKLILEDPIGLEDYRTFVPYQTLEELEKKEAGATYESYKKYQQTYYPDWKPEYEELVAVQAEALKDTNFKQIAKVNALTYDMIYQQPVCYELKNITAKQTLIITGNLDRTIVGRDKLSAAERDKHGRYNILGQAAQGAIPHSKLVDLPGVGHIPHIQQPDVFKKTVLDFLK